MYDTVLVPIDGSKAARRAADHALAIAERFDAEVHVLHVMDATSLEVSTATLDLNRVRESMEEHGREALDAIEALAEERGVPCTAALAEGRTAAEILDRADEVGADLIVMGTHGRSGVERWFIGSVTDRVVRGADVPVMTVSISEE